MEWNWKLIGIVTALFFLGYIIGLVEMRIKQRMKDNKAAVQTEKETFETPAQPAPAPSLLSLRRRATDALTVELGGKTLPGKEALTPADRKALVNLLVELRPWVEATPGEAKPTPPEPKQAVKPPAGKPAAKAGSAPAAEETPAKPPSESLVAQIDAVLQERLEGSALAGRGIRVQESASGGVAVYVGLQKYEGLDAMPEGQEKSAIQQAIKEWETRG